MTGRGTAKPLDPQLIEIRERIALREIVARYPNGGNQLEAAIRTAYRRALEDAGILPPQPAQRAKP